MCYLYIGSDQIRIELNDEYSDIYYEIGLELGDDNLAKKFKKFTLSRNKVISLRLINRKEKLFDLNGIGMNVERLYLYNNYNLEDL